MGSGASKLKYVVEHSSAEEVESLKEALSPDALAELEARLQQLPEPPATPASLRHAESTEDLVQWCRQIRGLQPKSLQTLVGWIEEREENGESFLMLEEEDLKEIGLKEGPLKVLLKRLKEEKESHSATPEIQVASPKSCTVDGSGAAQDADCTEVPEYSLEDATDLAKFLRNADICLVRAEYFWKLFDEGRIAPARRQELEDPDENVVKKDDGRSYASALVTHDEVDAWASGRKEALLCSISHSWESMEHADPTGDQCDRIASATALFAAAYAVPVWVFIDFLSIYQYKQTEEQRKKFRSAMENMHLLYSHESTMTLRLEHLSPYPYPKGKPSKNSSLVKIWHDASQEVKEVPRSELKNNDRPYQRRGWCRVEVQWSSTRSESHSNIQIDAHLGSEQEQARKFKCQVAEDPDQFLNRTRGERMEFMKKEDREDVLKLQRKVFFEKANEREHLVVENVEAPEIAVLAQSIGHYKCLKSLTLKHFLCEFQQAKALCEALAGMRDFPLTRLSLLEPGDAESKRVLEEQFEKCKVKEKNPNLQTIITKTGKQDPMQSDERRKKSRRPEPAIPSLLHMLQGDFPCGMFCLNTFVDKSVDDLRALLRALERSITVKCLWASFPEPPKSDWPVKMRPDPRLDRLDHLTRELKKIKLNRSSVIAFYAKFEASNGVSYLPARDWDSDRVGFFATPDSPGLFLLMISLQGVASPKELLDSYLPKAKEYQKCIW
eukprot:Skav236343  [mRNA]  locus=scaffold918:58995:61480:- [translate_table: standard]